MEVLGDEKIRAIDIAKYFNEKTHTLDFITYGRAIAQAQLEEDRKQVVEWGNELCQSGSHSENDMWPILKHDCSECWQDLEEQVGVN